MHAKSIYYCVLHSLDSKEHSRLKRPVHICHFYSLGFLKDYFSKLYYLGQ